MNNHQEPLSDIEIKDLFSEIVAALKEGKTSKVKDLPQYAIMQYYLKGRKHFSLLQEAFVEEYVNNESLVEGVRNEYEKKGLKLVYEYLFGDYNSDNIDINYLSELHTILYSKAPYPEAGGRYRREPARIDGTVISLCPWEEIPTRMNGLNKEINMLVKKSADVYGSNDAKIIFDYIEECLKLKCKLIQIHPFFDGNGRTIRAFINKLFTLAGIPPVYVHRKEKKIYHEVMEKAIKDSNYGSLFDFYYIKICQSIYELDLNPTSDLKHKLDLKKIIRITENYKVSDAQEKKNISDLSFMYARCIREELFEEGIHSEICSAKTAEDEDYEYLIAKLKKHDKIQDVLIDPLFSDYILEQKIHVPSGINDDEKEFLLKLYSDGAAKMNEHEYDLYLETLGVLGKNNTSKAHL